jgi:DNA mismatch repair protein MutL
MTIRRLSEGTVNRIAAGEVVERPAAAIKELVENAMDAGATRIDIAASNGGADLLLVEDDGIGMTSEDLRLAIERHATSKLPVKGGEDDLSHIVTMGFRGEALPSIGAVARLSLTSRMAGSEAAEIKVDGGKLEGPRPAAFLASGQHGTRAQVRELFYATPARLKFLKSTRSEDLAITDIVKRLAMARPDIGFTLTLDGRKSLDLPAEPDLMDGRLPRLARIMGREFGDNAARVEAGREGVSLSGYAGLPTYNRANAAMQFLFVNGRPVRDKQLVGAVRGAYADFLARDRHPALALFLDCDPAFVDVNVHPAKTEVRFRDAGLVRGLIVGALKHAIEGSGHRASTTVASSALAAFARQAPSPFQSPNIFSAGRAGRAGTGDRDLRSRCGDGARSPCHAGKSGCEGPGARPGRRDRRDRQCPVAEGAAGGSLRHTGLSHERARRTPPECRGDERPAARNGSHAPFRPVQSWPPDLCRAEVGGYRKAVRKTVRSCVIPA